MVYSTAMIELRTPKTTPVNIDPHFVLARRFAAELENAKTPLLTRIEHAAYEFSEEQHLHFDANCWNQEMSFHNWDHVTGTYRSVHALFGNLEQARNEGIVPDYLDPFVQLERYNEMMSKEYPSANVAILPHELELLLKTEFIRHDNGNTQIRKGTVLEDLDRYEGDYAESRTIEINEYYLSDVIGLADVDRFRYLKFFEYLTKQTEFIYDGSEVHRQNMPFGVFMRFIDVIGQGVMNQDTLMEQVAGLILEQHLEWAEKVPVNEMEEKDIEFIPANTFSFFWQYLKQILPDFTDEDRNRLVKRLLGSAIPEKPEFKAALYNRVKRGAFVAELQAVPVHNLKNHLLEGYSPVFVHELSHTSKLKQHLQTISRV